MKNELIIHPKSRRLFIEDKCSRLLIFEHNSILVFTYNQVNCDNLVFDYYYN